MNLNFVDKAIKFLLQGVNGRGLVEINLRLQKTPKIKCTTALDRVIWLANCYAHIGKKHIQQMTNAVHELFLGHLNNMFSSFIN